VLFHQPSFLGSKAAVEIVVEAGECVRALVGPR
jgi:hypothetical protein